MMSFLQLAAEKGPHFCQTSLFVKALDGRILYLIKPTCGDRFMFFLCQIVSKMMPKSSQNQFGLIEEIKHLSNRK